eukprot:jgi/Botrbrau1/13255/Bobra.0074s0004.1
MLHSSSSSLTLFKLMLYQLLSAKTMLDRTNFSLELSVMSFIIAAAVDRQLAARWVGLQRALPKTSRPAIMSCWRVNNRPWPSKPFHLKHLGGCVLTRWPC